MVKDLPLLFVGQLDLYSRRVLSASDEVVRCRKCGTYALFDSWQALPGCARWGCGSQEYWTRDDPGFFYQEAEARVQPLPAEPSESEIRVEILSEPEVEDRYTRIRQLGWDRDRLQNARALVVGAGALGNEVLKNLALLGWGHIIVVDMDTIEDSNLARSVLFRQSDVGPQSFKAKVAAERVREINPDVRIFPVVGMVQDCIGLGVFRRMDVVFGCLDNLQARLDVSRACWRTLTPYIDAGLDGINGDVHTFVPPYTACYGCTVPQSARRTARERHPCLKVKIGGPKPVMPTAPTISAMMAGWQTQIAVKHLHGRPIPASQRIIIFGSNDIYERYRVEPDPRCPDHSLRDILSEDHITQMPCRAASTTLGELIALARNELGMGPEAMVEFDFDLLLRGTCQKCGIRKEFYRRLTSVELKEIVCPGCNRVLSLETEYQFDGNEPYADRTLAELGVPPLHILLVKNWPRRLYKYIELSGDLDNFGDVLGCNPKLMPVRILLANDELHHELLPMRVPLQAIMAWRREEWGLGDEVASGQWVVTNLTQGFTYEPEDSLTGRDTHPDDLIRVEIGPPLPVQAEQMPVEITLEEITDEE